MWLHPVTHLAECAPCSPVPRGSVGEPSPCCSILRPLAAALPRIQFCFCPGAPACASSGFAHVRPARRGAAAGVCLGGSRCSIRLIFFFSLYSELFARQGCLIPPLLQQRTPAPDLDLQGELMNTQGCRAWRDVWRRVPWRSGKGEGERRDRSTRGVVRSIHWNLPGGKLAPPPSRGELRGRLSVIHLTCEVLLADPEVRRAYADGGYAVTGDKKACQHVRVNCRWH